MHPKSANALDSTGYRRFLLSYAQCSEKTVLSLCGSPFLAEEGFLGIWTSSCQLRAMAIASSSMGGCGLGHKCVENDCKDTCMKFGG